MEFQIKKLGKTVYCLYARAIPGEGWVWHETAPNGPWRWGQCCSIIIVGCVNKNEHGVWLNWSVSFTSGVAERLAVALHCISFTVTSLLCRLNNDWPVVRGVRNWSTWRKPLPNSKLVTTFSHDWPGFKLGSDERKQTVSGKAIDHSTIKAALAL